MEKLEGGYRGLHRVRAIQRIPGVRAIQEYLFVYMYIYRPICGSMLEKLEKLIIGLGLFYTGWWRHFGLMLRVDDVFLTQPQAIRHIDVNNLGVGAIMYRLMTAWWRHHDVYCIRLIYTGWWCHFCLMLRVDDVIYSTPSHKTYPCQLIRVDVFAHGHLSRQRCSGPQILYLPFFTKKKKKFYIFQSKLIF